MKLVYVLLSFNILYELCLCKLSCKDENNNDIDWYIGLKFPRSYNFSYLSSNTKTWKLSKNNLSDESNLIGLTIKQTYNSKQSDSFYAYYNDEPVHSFNYPAERGHLKGVISFNKISGFWLVHSVPKFPKFNEYIYGRSEEIYGQSFFCVSLDSINFEHIILQLLMMKSSVYSQYIPDNFPSDQNIRNLLKEFVNNKGFNKSEISNIIPITTMGNLPLLHFGKSGIFKKDLYDGLVAPNLKTSIMVESWIRGEKVNSSCESDFKVYNVQLIKLFDRKIPERDDHSKWAVSASKNYPFVCVGDINRMTSQFKRGGGTLCVKSSEIWTQFFPIVNTYENCESTQLNFLPRFILNKSQ